MVYRQNGYVDWVNGGSHISVSRFFKRLLRDVDLMDRCFEALVIAYSPNDILESVGGKGFYIPSAQKIEESYKKFIEARKEFLKSAECKNRPLRHPNIVGIQNRIFEGCQDLFYRDGEKDLSYFESCFKAGPFEKTNSNGGKVYRFSDRKAKGNFSRVAFRDRFEGFWTIGELRNWNQVQLFLKRLVP